MLTRVETKKKILVVDDSQTNLMILEDFLVFSGFDVISVDNGERCCVKAEEQQPDMILLDIMMPGIDGFETLKRLKRSKKTQKIPNAASDKYFLYFFIRPPILISLN